MTLKARASLAADGFGAAKARLSHLSLSKFPISGFFHTDLTNVVVSLDWVKDDPSK